MAKRKTKVFADASPSDRGNAVALRFKQGKIGGSDLYDELRDAGLNEEEASEMANLIEFPP